MHICRYMHAQYRGRRGGRLYEVGDVPSFDGSDAGIKYEGKGVIRSYADLGLMELN